MEQEKQSTIQEKLIEEGIIPISQTERIKDKCYKECLEKYKPLDINVFAYGADNNIKNKIMFMYEQKKYLLPFLFRKNRKIDFYTFVIRQSPRVMKIKDINQRLENFFKNGTQINKSFRKRDTKKNPIKNTFENYLLNSLEKRVALSLTKQRLFIRLLEVEDMLKGIKPLTDKNFGELRKEKENLVNKIEKLKIEIYEAQKHK